MAESIWTHSRSDGTPCDGCGCQLEQPHNVGGITLVGCCAIRTSHGTFRFDEDTGEVTQWPRCCAGYVHEGTTECAAHGVTKSEHTVVLTARGPILPLEEPEIRLEVVEAVRHLPSDTVVEALLADGRTVQLPAGVFPTRALPAVKNASQAATIPQYEPIIAPGLVVARGWVMLANGNFLPSIGRQFAQRRLDALIRRIERARFEATFRWKERERIMSAADPDQEASRIIRDHDRFASFAYDADIDDGTFTIRVTAMERRVNPHNPEDGGREFHHVAPLTSEVAVVHPMLAERQLALA